MWPVCVWAAGRVGEKEGEEAAEAAAPLISSFLNTFKPWCYTDRRGACGPVPGTNGAHAAGQQVGSPPTHPCRRLERGPPPDCMGPGAHRRWAYAHCQAAPERAGMLGRVMGTLSLQVLALPRALLLARGLAGASPRCFLTRV